ncbi:MAG TPA: nitroreductase family protein [Dyella sp.]|uniref:nitroreductase family protein n=1 Tax=Dyella sp. TaxID=1869338 RepID=UPI002CE294E2|nr:nitroreductase family protein [Dyella sp.]HUB90193.1 nitroreductase family protein [Dyella sp.]
MTSAEQPSISNLPRIRLPVPRHARRDVSLFEALERRRTIRQISSAPISLQTLSDLLWAACGVNRTDGPFGVTGRTAASASNSQEIDVYVAMRDAVYRFDALDLELAPVANGDLRGYAMTPDQRDANADIPVQLIYVADIHRLTHTRGFREPGLHDVETQKAYYYVDAGMISENVYLFCAGEGLAAWFHNCDKTALALRLGLREDQRVLFAQSVGYPENV